MGRLVSLSELGLCLLGPSKGNIFLKIVKVF